jgi:tetratricopeptide (TPR) repeat protein
VTLNVDELIIKSEDQYKRQRYNESIISAEAALEVDSESVNAWWFYALSKIALKDNDSALEALEIIVDLDPYFVNGLSRYGSLLLLAGRSKEAQEIYEKAIEVAPSNLPSLKALTSIYNDAKSIDNNEKELLVLLHLEELQDLTIIQRYRLGSIYYQNEHFTKAIKYWHYKEPTSLINLGDLYNNAKVLRKADAIDIWRLYLDLYPTNEKVLTRLNTLIFRIFILHKNIVSSNPTLLNSDKWYQYYINPFELFDIQEDEFDTVDQINIKELQKYKKTLLKEIELEDGAISWVDKLHIDRSRALGICDAIINDVTEREFHWQVFINKPLLGFLTRGEHNHFMVNEKWSPLETIEYLENNDNFRAWLSSSFTKQFDLILTTAINNNELAIVEVLLSGRLWVDIPYLTLCFEGARVKISSYLEGLRRAETQTNDTKPSFNEIEKLSNHNSLLKLLNLFPSHLLDLQDEFANIIINIAVSCNNKYKDSDLAIKILNISDELLFKSSKTKKRVEDNSNTIKGIIKQEREDEAFLTISKESCSITKEGIKKGTVFIRASSVNSARWGASIKENNAHNFLFVFESLEGEKIKFEWNASSDLENQKKFFQQFVDATYQYILPGLIERMKTTLEFIDYLSIGHCVVTSEGIEFEVKSWLGTKKAFIHWDRADFSFNNGNLIIKDKMSPKITTSLSLRNVDNAHAIQFLQI